MRVILVPGSKTKSLPFLDGPLKRFYARHGVEPGPDVWPEVLVARLGGAEIFTWDGGISWLSLERAARRLARRIEEGEEDVVLFGKSLGGALCMLAAAKSCKVKRVVCVATPHRVSKGRIPEGTDLVNIFSPSDSYHALANRLFRPWRTAKEIEGARNVCLQGLRHSDFNRDLVVEWEGKEIRLFDLYVEMIGRGKN